MLCLICIYEIVQFYSATLAAVCRCNLLLCASSVGKFTVLQRRTTKNISENTCRKHEACLCLHPLHCCNLSQYLLKAIDNPVSENSPILPDSLSFTELFIVQSCIVCKTCGGCLHDIGSLFQTLINPFVFNIYVGRDSVKTI